jgi:transcriptional regulator with XRE-family HTH domain
MTSASAESDPGDTPYARELSALLEAFADNVRELRMRNHPDLSQQEVAERAVLHRTEWGMIEAGKRNPRFSTLLVLAQALEVSLDELAEGIDPPVHRKPPPANKKGKRPAR